MVYSNYFIIFYTVELINKHSKEKCQLQIKHLSINDSIQARKIFFFPLNLQYGLILSEDNFSNFPSKYFNFNQSIE